MTTESYILIATIAVALYLFITEKVSIDLTAILIAVILMITGVVSIPEGLSGFSNQATVTILALLILSAGLEETGLLERIGLWMANLGSKNVPVTLALIMVPSAFFSAFLNNTAVITIFLPIVITIAAKRKISPSLLLMPVAFISILGGMSTLIGTSTNLLVNSVARQYNTEVLAFFEFMPYGLAGVGFCLLFFLIGGYKLIPERMHVKSYNQKFTNDKFQAEIKVSDPRHLYEVNIEKLLLEKNIEILKLLRSGEEMNISSNINKLKEGDRIIVKGGIQELVSIQEDHGIGLHTGNYQSLKEGEGSILVETVVSPGSALAGNLFNPTSFQRRFGAHALALRQVNDVYFKNMGRQLFAMNRINIGDSILVEAPPGFFENPRVQHDLILYRQFHQKSSKPIYKQMLALAIMILVVILAALDVVPIPVSALGGVVLMAFLGIFKSQTIYERIDWRIYFLLAGIIPLGIAMQNTGLDNLLASQIVSVTAGFAPFWIILSFFALTTLVTNFISNNAAALLMAPIVLTLAGQTGIDPKALLMTVAFGASTCFISPLGYHTLAIIYGPGKYRFGDYFRAGLPLTIMIIILFSLMLDYNFNGEAAVIRQWLN